MLQMLRCWGRMKWPLYVMIDSPTMLHLSMKLGLQTENRKMFFFREKLNGRRLKFSLLFFKWEPLMVPPLVCGQMDGYTGVANKERFRVFLPGYDLQR